MNVLHTHLGDAPVTGPAAPGSVLQRLGRAALAGLDAWSRAGQEREQLAQLDGRALHDLAITRVDVARELEAPVWPSVAVAVRNAWRRS